MIPLRKHSSSAPHRPAGRLRAAAFVPVVAALGLVGCGGAGPLTNAYGGTGVLHASGASSEELAHEDVRITWCPAVRQDAWQGPWYPAFSVLNIGDRCTIRGRWEGGTFVAAPGGTCSLRLPGRAVDIRVSDVTAWFGSYARVHAGRADVVPDDTFVEVLLGGAAANARGDVDHVLYSFRGAVAAQENAGEPCRRVDVGAAPGSSVPSSPPPTSAKTSDWDI